MEGLNLIIKDAQIKGTIKGMQVSSLLAVTHLLFVNDVILFGMVTFGEWKDYKEALDLFCSATGHLPTCLLVSKNHPSCIMMWT